MRWWRAGFSKSVQQLTALSTGNPGIPKIVEHIQKGVTLVNCDACAGCTMFCQ